jgi:hypothetical protein
MACFQYHLTTAIGESVRYYRPRDDVYSITVSQQQRNVARLSSRTQPRDLHYAAPSVLTIESINRRYAGMETSAAELATCGETEWKLAPRRGDNASIGYDVWTPPKHTNEQKGELLERRAQPLIDG